MITFKQQGDFKRLNNFFQKMLEPLDLSILDKYGRKGVEALARVTPIDTGKTAMSWNYEVIRERGHASLIFTNSNVNDNVNIAIILQYGHGTRNGGYVQGVDYINPALQPIFEELADAAWKELTS